MSDHIQWLTTAPNPRARPSADPTGWKYHAVPASEDEAMSSVSDRRATCGLRPRYGWDIDLFIPNKKEHRCMRCRVALGEDNK